MNRREVFQRLSGAAVAATCAPALLAKGESVSAMGSPLRLHRDALAMAMEPIEFTVVLEGQALKDWIARNRMDLMIGVGRHARNVR